MSEHKHTPGPWSFTGEEDNDFIVWQADESFLANVGGSRISQVPMFDDVKNGTVAFDIKDRANAALISASPEMFQALADCVDCLIGGADSKTKQEAIANANTALAKARGEA